MSLQDLLLKQGTWLFNRRSFLPLIFIPIIVSAMVYIANTNGGIQKKHKVYEYSCLAVSLAGLAIRCITVGYVPKGTTGRTTHGFEAQSLNTTGMYSIVKHPMYLGNFIIYLGIALFTYIWWLVLLFILFFWFYYERIMYAEEEFLKREFGNTFNLWAAKTPVFLPNIKLWSSSDKTFSIRTVLKREYSGQLAIFVSFSFINIMNNTVYLKKFQFDFNWMILLIVSTIIYITLRLLKKKTKVLDVIDR
jgi:protein-S-isoprenylcysteine O-methyltransferase Ste14